MRKFIDGIYTPTPRQRGILCNEALVPRACGVTAALSSNVMCTVSWNLVKTENGSFMRASQFLLLNFPKTYEWKFKKRKSIHLNHKRNVTCFLPLYFTNCVEPSCSRSSETVGGQRHVLGGPECLEKSLKKFWNFGIFNCVFSGGGIVGVGFR